MRCTKVVLAKLVVLGMLLFGIFLFLHNLDQNVAYKANSDGGKRNNDSHKRPIPLVKYISKVSNSSVALLNTIKRQRDALTEELIERTQNIGTESSDAIVKTFKEQRDALGEMLNKVRQQLGKLDCEVNCFSFPAPPPPPVFMFNK